MRTTIEMKDEHRARLMELAARRGQKGFSSLVEEAIEAYLQNLDDSAEREERALATRGALSDSDASELEERTGALREHWR